MAVDLAVLTWLSPSPSPILLQVGQYSGVPDGGQTLPSEQLRCLIFARRQSTQLPWQALGFFQQATYAEILHLHLLQRLSVEGSKGLALAASRAYPLLPIIHARARKQARAPPRSAAPQPHRSLRYCWGFH